MKDHALLPQPFGQFDQRLARIEMAFAGKEQALPEPPGEIGFQRIDAVLIDCIEGFRPAGEAAQLAHVPRVGEHERSLAPDGRDVALPPADGILPEAHHGFFGAFALAPGSQHSARKPRAAVGADLGTFGDDGDGMALICKLGGSGKTGHTRSDDGDAHHAISPVRVFQRS
jgi:hypothetical protein